MGKWAFTTTSIPSPVRASQFQRAAGTLQELGSGVNPSNSSLCPGLALQDQRPAVWPRLLFFFGAYRRFVLDKLGDEQAILVMIDRPA